MEDEKNKKKRNKKKKNKQNKTADEVAAVGGGEATSEDQNHASNGKDDHGQIAESADVGNGGKDLDVGLTRNGPNGTDSMVLAESEKQQWLQREAVLEETIKQLQIERDFHIQKETTLEDTIDKLRKENNLHLQKEATFEMKIVELQSEIESWIRKEGHLEARISHLVDEKTTWSLKEVSLQEKLEHLENEKRAWTLNEDLIRETIANLNDDVLRLRVQVVELEESRNNVLQENQQLLENVSSLQLQIKDLHSIASTQSSDEFTKLSSERDELSSQVEAACTLVERLIAENAELVEKVNELFIELDRRGGSLLPSTAAYKLMVGTAETASFSDRGSETITDVPKSGQELNSIEVVEVKEEMNGIHKSDNHRTDVVAEPKIFEEAGEIVQIPLDENEVPDLELQVNLNGERDSVPISDAPLIGAPFRLISFVSRYVSGADLVNKNSLQV
ncbi:myosin-11 isoform X2 [Morus notabilis]|uniref:myosin-11 isoform X2 n=1 Tax=Morus notabilis TaxID=981085 RepID=UPI000CED328A|nr:myosin-11 isoform X2 [Morus notabilis]